MPRPSRYGMDMRAAGSAGDECDGSVESASCRSPRAALASELTAGPSAPGLKDIWRQTARSAERAVLKKVLE